VTGQPVDDLTHVSGPARSARNDRGLLAQLSFGLQPIETAPDRLEIAPIVSAQRAKVIRITVPTTADLDRTTSISP